MDGKISWSPSDIPGLLLIGQTNGNITWYIECDLYETTKFFINASTIPSYVLESSRWLLIKCKNAPTFQTVDAAKNYCEHLQELWVYREKNSYIDSN